MSGGTSGRSHARRLAGFLAELEPAQLPAGSAELLKLCLLDTLACMVGGLGTPSGPVMQRMARRMGSVGGASMVGERESTDPATAALVNGTLGHALIFDDMHRHAKLHPGVITVPAVLAAAEMCDADGATALAGLAAGYEACGRVGIALDMSAHRKAGWRATGTAGSIGAAAAVARVLGLNAAGTHQALAAGAAQASGTFAFQSSGGMELYLAAGTAARNGVAAGLLAEAGWQGADQPLEAEDGGYLVAASASPDPAALSEGLGTAWRLRDVCIKRHPTCHSTQTGIDAALMLREAYGVRPADVERIVVEAGEITRLQCGWAFEPSAPEKLIFHLGLAIAIALESGEIRPADYEGNRVKDPALLRLARATEVRATDELTAIYKERKPSIVFLHLKDGRVLRQRVDFCRGEPENPPDFRTVLAKAKSVCEGHLSVDDVNQLADHVMTLEKQTSLRAITGILRLARATGRDAG